VKYISKLLSAVFLIFFIYYLTNNPQIFDVFKQIRLESIFILIFVKFISLYLNGLFNKKLILVYEIKLNHLEALYVASITYLGNLYFPARVGAGLRLAYFKKFYKLDNSYILIIFGYFFIVSLFINAIFGLLSLFFIENRQGSISIFWFVIFMISIISTTYLLVKKFNLKIVSKKNKFQKSILDFTNKAREGWNKITLLRGTNLYLISIYVLNYFLFFFEILLIFLFLEELINIPNLVFYNSISVFSNLLGLTPAAIGIKEFLILGTNELFNIEISRLAQILIVERAISVLFSSIPITISVIFNKIKK